MSIVVIFIALLVMFIGGVYLLISYVNRPKFGKSRHRKK